MVTATTKNMRLVVRHPPAHMHVPLFFIFLLRQHRIMRKKDVNGASHDLRFVGFLAHVRKGVVMWCASFGEILHSVAKCSITSRMGMRLLHILKGDTLWSIAISPKTGDCC